MIRQVFFIWTAVTVFSLVVSCTAKPTAVTPSSESVEVVSPQLQYTPALTTVVAQAHSKYLTDPMKFAPLPDGGVSDGQTAVVGSKVARFYPLTIQPILEKASKAAIKVDDIPRNADGRYAKDWTMDDLKALPSGTPVEFGTIIPLLAGEASGPLYGLYGFEGNFNKFYRTSFQGQEGYIFGADLYGLTATQVQNQVASELYTTSGRPEAFHAVYGFQPLSSQVAGRLEQNRLALQRTVYGKDYSLWTTSPDDMISIYKDLQPGWNDNRYRTVFVTTDVVAHAQHLVFDRLLQHEEEVYFVPRLKALVDSLVLGVSTWQKSHADTDAWTITLATQYLQVAQALLALAPEAVRKDDEYGRSHIEYQDVDRDTVLSTYPAAVRQEVALIENAAGMTPSIVLTKDSSSIYREDYSQYKPRGHYTKNGVLGAYFRAMMWFGRVNFLIAKDDKKPITSPDGTSGSATDLSLAMGPSALLMADLIGSDSGLFKAWADLFDPITDLIGQSDDLSFQDVCPLWKAQNVTDFGSWVASKDNLVAFMKLAHDKLKPPSISGNSVMWGPSEGEDHNPPMGWRLFGQRFTWDSWVHEQVSPPRLMSRDMVRGLDIMKAFGSKTANQLLAQSDYPKMPGLEDRLNSVAQVFSDRTTDEWKKTFYDQTLFLVRSQALFEPGVGFYFTESPAWGLKAMLSSHGTWSELRHDTLLYVKQTAAERAGDGDFDPTFRIEPLPQPIHYIEPNLPFWQGAANAVHSLRATLSQYGLLDDEGSVTLSQLEGIDNRAVGIVETEIADQPVPRADLDWITTIAGELAPIVMAYNRGDSIDDTDSLKMACIADVYTNFETGQVLETGVGQPLRMYVPLNDGQGGKRIAIGFTYSYYEFTHPLNDRLTDETWKAQVYPDSAKVNNDLPFWAQGLALPPEAKQSQ